MSRCDRKAIRRILRGPCVAALVGATLSCAAAPSSAAVPGNPSGSDFWLKFGTSVRLCPGARAAVPAKLEGATWGVLASGILSCRDLGQTYQLKVDYLNVFVDPNDHTMLTQASLRFDWFGLALYRRAGSAHDVDWLLDEAHPVKGELRRDAAGRIVFGGMSFSVPKIKGESATNMLFYLTFGGPLVAINVR